MFNTGEFRRAEQCDHSSRTALTDSMLSGVRMMLLLFLEDLNPSFDGRSSWTSAVYLEMPME